MIPAEQFGAVINAVCFAVVVAMALGVVAGNLGTDLLAFALSKWPAYRVWRRKMRRADRLEFWSAEREEQVFQRRMAARLLWLEQQKAQRALDKSAGGVRW